MKLASILSPIICIMLVMTVVITNVNAQRIENSASSTDNGALSSIDNSSLSKVIKIVDGKSYILEIRSLENPISPDDIAMWRGAFEQKSTANKNTTRGFKIRGDTPLSPGDKILAYGYYIDKNNIPHQFKAISGGNSSIPDLNESINAWYNDHVLNTYVGGGYSVTCLNDTTTYTVAPYGQMACICSVIDLGYETTNQVESFGVHQDFIQTPGIFYRRGTNPGGEWKDSDWGNHKAIIIHDWSVDNDRSHFAKRAFFDDYPVNDITTPVEDEQDVTISAGVGLNGVSLSMSWKFKYQYTSVSHGVDGEYSTTSSEWRTEIDANNHGGAANDLRENAAAFRPGSTVGVQFANGAPNKLVLLKTRHRAVFVRYPWPIYLDQGIPKGDDLPYYENWYQVEKL